MCANCKGLTLWNQLLCSKLNIGRVVIIPGDSDQEEVVKREIGLCGRTYFKQAAGRR